MRLSTAFGKCFCTIEQNPDESKDKDKPEDQQHAAGNDQ